MKFRYDLHLHSALSPCADNNMTPVVVAGRAMLTGLHFAAIADHNAIGNVKVAMAAGKEFGIKIVPAMELQTSEDIHILCLFERFKDLKSFFGQIKFSTLQNRKEIFGRQLILDEDDNIVAEEPRMLLAGADISSDEVPALARKYGGVAIPAHIDREMNGMLAILGTVTDEYNTVEFSTDADKSLIDEWAKTKKVIVDSDSHTLSEFTGRSQIELDKYSIKSLLNALR